MPCTYLLPDDAAGAVAAEKVAGSDLVGSAAGVPDGDDDAFVVLRECQHHVAEAQVDGRPAQDVVAEHFLDDWLRYLLA